MNVQPIEPKFEFYSSILISVNELNITVTETDITINGTKFEVPPWLSGFVKSIKDQAERTEDQFKNTAEPDAVELGVHRIFMLTLQLLSRELTSGPVPPTFSYLRNCAIRWAGSWGPDFASLTEFQTLSSQLGQVPYSEPQFDMAKKVFAAEWTENGSDAVDLENVIPKRDFTGPMWRLGFQKGYSPDFSNVAPCCPNYCTAQARQISENSTNSNEGNDITGSQGNDKIARDRGELVDVGCETVEPLHGTATTTHSEQSQSGMDIDQGTTSLLVPDRLGLPQASELDGSSVSLETSDLMDNGPQRQFEPEILN